MVTTRKGKGKIYNLTRDFPSGDKKNSTEKHLNRPSLDYDTKGKATQKIKKR
jgi:hypothetical protein